MRKHRIILSTVLLVLVLGTLAPQFAQDTQGGSAEEPDSKREAIMIDLVRSINIMEVTERSEYGATAPWPILLAHHQEEFNVVWLKRAYGPDAPNIHFSDLPEILPGFQLRLNVQGDGKGWVVLLDDSTDKDGFAAVSDERGRIRLCKYLGH